MTEKLRTITANDMHVILTQFLSAAESIHVAMCRFGDDHAAQKFLNEALQSALIGAEECRKLHAAEKVAVPQGQQT